MQRLLEPALTLADSDDPLYRAALEVERHADLDAQIEEWASATVGDGLDAEVPPAATGTDRRH